MFKTLIISAVATLAITGTAIAHEYQAGDLHIDHPVARETPANAPVSAGYMTIRNDGTETDRLVGGSVDFAETVEIHEMTMDGDVMQMREIEGGIEIAPGEEVKLVPGGLHVMFIGMEQRLEAGQQHTGTLTFENAGDVEVVFEVESLSQIREAMDNGMHHGHDEMHMDTSE